MVYYCNTENDIPGMSGIAQFQAKETTEIPKEVFNGILNQIKRERITNMATLKGWSPIVVMVDMFWGGFLTAISAYSGILIAKKLLL